MAPVDAASLEAYRRIAERAAALAAESLRAPGDDLRGAVSSLGHDIKIKGDAHAERALLDFLSREAPLPILSEESGLTGPAGGGTLRWIVDPIDGSLNFNRGLPLSCVSVALWDGDRPLVGVVHDFNRGEVFSGAVGAGAFLNGTPVRVSGVAEVGDAVLCTGFPVYTDFAREPLLAFLERVRAYKKVRLLGSAALSLAYVAAGRADAYREDNIMLWDVAAGLALVAAAGGRYGMEALAKGLRIEAGNGRV